MYDVHRSRRPGRRLGEDPHARVQSSPPDAGGTELGGSKAKSGTQPTLTEEDALAIRRNLRDVQVAAPLLSRNMPLVAGNRNWTTLVAGINPDYLIAREWQISIGRPFTATELISGAKVAIVGSVVARELFEDGTGLGQTFRIGAVPFSVIAILDNKGLGAAGRSQDDVVFIPLATAKSRVLGAVRGVTRNALDFISIKVADAAVIPQVKDDVEVLLRDRHHLRKDTPSDFRIEDPAEVLTARKAAVQTLNVLLVAVASVSLVVGGISIMNIMLVSINERTREIGLRIAVGARRHDIRHQFLIEALTLGLMGGIVGATLGVGSAAAIALEAGWPILINPWAIILACGFAGLVGVLFGLYPARRAAHLDPIVALQFE